MEKNKWTFSDIPNLSEKTIIVTGGNSGLGYESVKAFAQKGANVVLTSRSEEKGINAKKSIEKEKISGTIDVMQLDLQDFTSIESFAEKFKTKYKKLDVLLNNAGIMTTPYFKTKSGFEGQIGTNHFGHFKLTGLLFDTLLKTKNSRIVNVSSMAHKQGVMNFDNLMFENGKDYTPMKSYGQSKLANLLFTYELQRLLEAKKSDCIAVAAHPGVAKTNLAHHLEKKLMFKILAPMFLLLIQKADMGALPQIRACTDPNVKGGQYYGPKGRMGGYPVLTESNDASHSKSDAKKLWDISVELTGEKFEF